MKSSVLLSLLAHVNGRAFPGCSLHGLCVSLQVSRPSYLCLREWYVSSLLMREIFSRVLSISPTWVELLLDVSPLLSPMAVEVPACSCSLSLSSYCITLIHSFSSLSILPGCRLVPWHGRRKLVWSTCKAKCPNNAVHCIGTQGFLDSCYTWQVQAFKMELL